MRPLFRLCLTVTDESFTMKRPAPSVYELTKVEPYALSKINYRHEPPLAVLPFYS